MKYNPNRPVFFETIKQGLTIEACSEEETKSVGKDLVSCLSEKAILLFTGDLGAGKTTFIKGMSEGLGINPFLVTSPTFSLLHIYNAEKALYHFDLYRLSNKEEFIHLGLEEILSQKGIFCIEWPERIKDIKLDGEIYSIQMMHKSLEKRIIIINPVHHETN